MKPSQLFTWATNALYSVGLDVGTPTKIAPSPGDRAQGALRGFAAIAQHYNYLFHEVQDWLGYVDRLPTDPDFVGEDFAWTGNHTHDGYISTTEGIFLGSAASVSRDPPLLRTEFINLKRGVFTDNTGLQILGGNYRTEGGIFFPSTSSAVRYILPIDAPRDYELTNVRLSMSLSTSKNITVSLIRTRHAVATPGDDFLIATDSRTGVTGAQHFNMPIAGGSINSAGNDTWHLEVANSNSGASDSIWDVQISYNDPGSRPKVG